MPQQHEGSVRHTVYTLEMSFTIKASRTDGTVSLNTLTKQRSIPSHRRIDLSDQFLKIVGSHPLEAD